MNGIWVFRYWQSFSYHTGNPSTGQRMHLNRSILFVFSIVLQISCTLAESPEQLRIATFNVAMGLENDGELAARLKAGDDERLAKLAEILQQVRPDIVLLNEFDYSPGSADLLRRNYLEKPQSGKPSISYSSTFLAPVNTGVDSGMDFNRNGRTGDPEDAWGFGHFPGQYGMLVLSRYPINISGIRSFRQFLWKDMPGALRPMMESGESYYPDETWNQLRLSSKSHWDIPLKIGDNILHFLVSHPTPTVFDGPEDRNGRRNHDENRIWVDYIQHGAAFYLHDDAGKPGGLKSGSVFVIAGDLNADPLDGGWMVDSMRQLLQHPQINASCIPRSKGAAEATELQAGINLQHRGNPATDTADFNDEYAGNLRIDFLLPSKDLKLKGCGVYWPARNEDGHQLVEVSDHRLVWIDLEF